MKPLSREIGFSVTMRLDSEARRLAAAGADIINLTAGQVDLPMPEVGKEAAAAALREDRTGYVPAAGSADLLEAVRLKMGWNEGSIIVSSGAKPLLSAAFACVCGPGDEVLLPTPCYTSYPEMIGFAGSTPEFVPCSEANGFVLTPEDLEKRVSPRTKALLLNNPVNPTGVVYSCEVLRAVADFCAANDIWIIADEVYDRFVYDGNFVSLYEFEDVRERLILVNSASKSYAMAGLRLGYAVVPDAARGAIAAFLSQMTGCPCSISERAAMAVLAFGDEYSDDLRRTFRKRRDLLISELADIRSISVAKSSGAFYLWINIDNCFPDNDVSFCRDLLLSKGVALTPGSAFLCPGYVRLAYTQDEPRLLEAARRLRNFVQAYRT